MYTALLAMYTHLMRRLQIYIDEELDDLLRVESRREGRSKAALIRAAVRERYAGYTSGGLLGSGDPLDAWVGSIEAEPGDIDAVVYDE
jgi:hypothetical protein